MRWKNIIKREESVRYNMRYRESVKQREQNRDTMIKRDYEIERPSE